MERVVPFVVCGWVGERVVPLTCAFARVFCCWAGRVQHQHLTGAELRKRRKKDWDENALKIHRCLTCYFNTRYEHQAVTRMDAEHQRVHQDTHAQSDDMVSAQVSKSATQTTSQCRDQIQLR